jgi:hypothetical protein
MVERNKSSSNIQILERLFLYLNDARDSELIVTLGAVQRPDHEVDDA